MLKHVKTKILTILLVTTLLSVALLGYYFGALAAHVGDVTEVWVQPPFHQTSYVVGQYNSTFYYGQNGTTGEYEWLSTNSSYVFNSVEGNVFLSSGQYTLTEKIDVTGKQISFYANSPLDTILVDSRAGASETIYTSPDLTPVTNLTIRNIGFDRSGAGDYTKKNAVNGAFHWLTIEGCRFIGNEALADYTGNRHLSGAVLGDYASDKITNFIFRNNYIIDWQYGALGSNSEYVLEENNYIENAQTWALGVTQPDDGATITIDGNTLVDCGWYDEGIAIDNHDPASAVVVNGLITNNIINNTAGHGISKPIAVVTTSGVTVSNNRFFIDATDSIYWGCIGVDGRTNCLIEDVNIIGNTINSKSHYGIRATDLVSGTIKNNQINIHDFSSDGAGMRIAWSTGKDLGTGTVSIENNNIAVSGSAGTKEAINIRKTSASGTGTITVQIDANICHAATRFISTDIADDVVVTVGKNNYYSVSGTFIYNGGAVSAKVMSYSGTAEASDTDSITFGVTFVTTPQIVIITVNENDARYIAMAYSISATEFNLYLWDDTGSELETTDKTISWYAEYKP